MEDIRSKKDAFIKKLLEERDRQYREMSRLQSMLEELGEVAKMKSTYENTISAQQDKITSLESQVEYLKRRVWGKSSERFINENPLQRRIDFDGLELLPEEEEEAGKAILEIKTFQEKKEKVRIKEKPSRNPLAENLPRKEEHIYPQVDHPENYDELPPEITEVLEFEPGKFYVRRIIRHKYALKTISEDTIRPIVTAPMPQLPIARSYAGSTLLAELMINKYVNHLPFYRQIQLFKREGMKLAAATINGWFKETADLLRPMYYRLQELVLGSDYIQVDETTIPVILEEKQKAAKSYIWLLRSVMDSLVFFHYDNGSRAQKVVIPLLKDYQGALQTDGYAVYSSYV